MSNLLNSSSLHANIPQRLQVAELVCATSLLAFRRWKIIKLHIAFFIFNSAARSSLPMAVCDMPGSSGFMSCLCWSFVSKRLPVQLTGLAPLGARTREPVRERESPLTNKRDSAPVSCGGCLASTQSRVSRPSAQSVGLGLCSVSGGGLFGFRVRWILGLGPKFASQHHRPSGRARYSNTKRGTPTTKSGRGVEKNNFGDGIEVLLVWV